MQRRKPALNRKDLGATPFSFFRMIAHRFGDTPERMKLVLEGTGVEPGSIDDTRVAFNLSQQVKQIDNLNRLIGSDWVLKASKLFGPSSHDALGIAILNAPTVRAGLMTIRTQLPKRVTSVKVNFKEARSDARLSIDLGPDLKNDHARPLAEIFLLSTLGFIEAQLPRAPEGARLSFACPAPAHATALSAHTGIQVDYGARSHSIVVPAKYLDVNPTFADPSLHALAVERLELDARRSSSADGIRASVERLLAGSAHGRLDANLVARSIGLSTRTLTRKLSEAKTDMRELTDAELQRRAQAYLKSNNFTMAEISERLGYADPTGFSRAHRRWSSEARKNKV